MLNEHFKLDTRNDFSKSSHKSNKYLMQETIRKVGLLAVNQTLVNELEPLLLWVQNNGYPVVLKPEESAGTDGVFICHEENQVKKAFEAIMSSKSVHGFSNQHVVAQEMLMGDEFMVNTVSKGMDILVTEIILGKKTILKDSPLYDYALIIGETDPRFSLIANYVKQVLPALGFSYGAAHTEVIVTKKGPTLVEVNCRLTGAFDMSSITDALGTNQVDALVNSYIKPDYCATELQTDMKINSQIMLAAFFIAKESKEISQTPNLRLFSDIPGFHSIKFGPKKGSKLPDTTSLMNSPGMVSFVGKNLKSLFQSLELFRNLEGEFYQQACIVDTNKQPIAEPMKSTIVDLKSSTGNADFGVSKGGFFASNILNQNSNTPHSGLSLNNNNN